MTPTQIIPLEGPLHHVQGIDIERERLWVSSVDKERRTGHLFAIALPSGKIQQQTEVQDGPRYHPGGLCLDGGDLWLPVAEYRRASTTQIQRRDKRTLMLVQSFSVVDHIGCLAASANRLFGGNWDSLDIYEWTKKGTLSNKRTNISGTRYQDMKFAGNRLIGGGLRSKTHGAVDFLDPQSLEIRRRIEFATTDRGVVFTNEGMTVKGNMLYLLPEDEPSRLFVFPLNSP